jgi:ubiquinone/menaquinone biosynthesis C-methylase UbiE
MPDENSPIDHDSQKIKEDAEFAFYDKFYEEMADDPQKPWCGEYARRMIKGELMVACPDLDNAMAEKIVLNIGSGCTGLLRAFATPSLKIELDPLIGRYREAEKVSIRQTAKTILLQAYAEDIPISDAFVDVIVCRNALDHVDSLDKAAAEITRVLKPCGLFLLVVDIHQGKTLHEPSPIQNQEQLLNLFDNFIFEFMEVREIPAFENFLNRKPIIRPTCYARLRKK